jgi:hypothetical protein
VAFYDGPWWLRGDTCTEAPLAYGTPGPGCAPPRDLTLGLQVTPGSGELPVVVSLGEVVDGRVHEHVFGSNACEERDAADLLWSLYPMGEPFDVQYLLPLTELARGDHRVQVLHDAVGDTVLTPVPGDNGAVVLFDADRDERCIALRSVDGDWGCLPESVASTEPVYYADSACSQPVIGLDDTEAELVALRRRNFCVREGFADEVLGVYALGEAYGGPLYGGPECALVAEQAEPGYVAVVEQAGAFPALVEQTE